MSCLEQKWFKPWCDKYHPLIIKNICEVINDNLVIVLFLLLLKIRPKILGNIILKI
jgi:hypothetical protein